MHFLTDQLRSGEVPRGVHCVGHERQRTRRQFLRQTLAEMGTVAGTLAMPSWLLGQEGKGKASKETHWCITEAQRDKLDALDYAKVEFLDGPEPGTNVLRVFTDVRGRLRVATMPFLQDSGWIAGEMWRRVRHPETFESDSPHEGSTATARAVHGSGFALNGPLHGNTFYISNRHILDALGPGMRQWVAQSESWQDIAFVYDKLADRTKGDDYDIPLTALASDINNTTLADMNVCFSGMGATYMKVTGKAYQFDPVQFQDHSTGEKFFQDPGIFCVKVALNEATRPPYKTVKRAPEFRGISGSPVELAPSENSTEEEQEAKLDRAVGAFSHAPQPSWNKNDVYLVFTGPEILNWYAYLADEAIDRAKPLNIDRIKRYALKDPKQGVLRYLQ